MLHGGIVVLSPVGFALTLTAVWAAQGPAPLASGDWVGAITIQDSAIVVRARFTSTPTLAGTADFPGGGTWGVRLFDVRATADTLAFALLFRGDTARFEGRVQGDGLEGVFRTARDAWPARFLHRMAYDSTVVGRLTGNYRIAADRLISMGPLDEVGGWLSFFDSKTRRGGILYATSDTTFFTGPSLGIDYPVAIRVHVQLDAHDAVRGLTWCERGAPPLEARRLDDHVTEDVTFANGPVQLAGTVTIPRSSGPHPAVILIHGAGGTTPTRDFGYWASYFAGHGIAVLAFDKRGGGASSGDINTATYEDLADDVLAGLAYLRTRTDIDSDRIGFYGTSNGGYIAPLAAARSGGRVAFITVRSGSARRVGDNIGYELGNDLRSLGYAESAIAEAVAIRQRVTDFVLDHPVISEPAWDSLVAEVVAVQQEPWYPWSRVLWVPRVSPSDSGAMAFVNSLRAQWRYDPVPYWRTVRVPVYIMLGGLDRSVPTAESARLLREALAANPDATVRVFADGNHGLFEARTGYANESSTLSHYVEGYQDSLIAWIQERR